MSYLYGSLCLYLLFSPSYLFHYTSGSQIQSRYSRSTSRSKSRPPHGNGHHPSRSKSRHLSKSSSPSRFRGRTLSRQYTSGSQIQSRYSSPLRSKSRMPHMTSGYSSSSKSRPHSKSSSPSRSRDRTVSRHYISGSQIQLRHLRTFRSKSRPPPSNGDYQYSPSTVSRYIPGTNLRCLTPIHSKSSSHCRSKSGSPVSDNKTNRSKNLSGRSPSPVSAHSLRSRSRSPLLVQSRISFSSRLKDLSTDVSTQDSGSTAIKQGPSGVGAKYQNRLDKFPMAGGREYIFHYHFKK